MSERFIEFGTPNAQDIESQILAALPRWARKRNYHGTIRFEFRNGKIYGCRLEQTMLADAFLSAFQEIVEDDNE